MPTDPTPTAADLVRDIFAAHGRHRITDGALMDDVARALATARRDADAAGYARGYARGRAEGLREAVLVNGSTPYPLLDVLRILCEVADHALAAHSCDHHGYEVWGEARDAGRECIRELMQLATVGGSLEVPLTAPPPTPEPTPEPTQPCCGCDSAEEPADCECADYCPHDGPCQCDCHRGPTPASGCHECGDSGSVPTGDYDETEERDERVTCPACDGDGGDAPESMVPLTICAAGSDGECYHPKCPQIRDGEPEKSGRHCPLDTRGDDDV